MERVKTTNFSNINPTKMFPGNTFTYFMSYTNLLIFTIQLYMSTIDFHVSYMPHTIMSKLITPYHVKFTINLKIYEQFL